MASGDPYKELDEYLARRDYTRDPEWIAASKALDDLQTRYGKFTYFEDMKRNDGRLAHRYLRKMREIEDRHIADADSVGLLPTPKES